MIYLQHVKESGLSFLKGFRLIDFSYLALLVILFISQSGTLRAQGQEDFSSLSLSGSSYVNGSFTGNNGIVWNYASSRGDQILNGTALCFGKSTSSLIANSVPNGIGSFECKIKRGFTSSSYIREVELFINDVSKGVCQASVVGQVYTFAVSDINVSGDIKLELRNTSASGKQILIDDISWTAYGSAPTPTIGNGTQSAAFNIAQAIALPTGSTEYFAQGFIVGVGTDFTAPFTNQYYITVADNAAETDFANCLNLKLEAGTNRDTWNLQYNPDVLGTFIVFDGFRDLYNSHASFEGNNTISSTTSGGSSGETGTQTQINFAQTSSTKAENAGSFTVDVTLTNASSTSATTVSVSLGSTADISSYTQTVSFAAGVSTAQISIAINDDSLVEGTEQFVFTLINPSGGTTAVVGANSSFTLSIIDNDSPPTTTYGTPIQPTYGQVNRTGPATLYDALNGLSGTNLRNTLQSIVVNSTTRAHNYGDIWAICEAADENPANENEVWLIYVEQGMNKADHVSGSYGWNREHIFPQSRGGFKNGTSTSADGMSVFTSTSSSSITHAHADGHHLRAADNQENSARSSLDYANVNGPRTKNSSFYEPPLSAKGDVARALFYMAVRYDDLSVVSGLGSGQSIGDLATLLQWHQLDPADDYEMHRNNVVYLWQNNRNPFIDQPELADYIFGGLTNATYSSSAQKAGRVLAENSSPVTIFAFGKQVFVKQATDETAQLEIYSILGQKVYSQPVQAVVSKVNLNAGLYVVSYKSGSRSITQKVLLK